MSKKKQHAPSFEERETVIDDKNGSKSCHASLRPLSTGKGPVAVKTPNDNVQLTPVVQPIALVPYSSQAQPLLTYDYNGMPKLENKNYLAESEDDYNKVEEAFVAPTALACCKKNRKAPLFIILLSLLACSLMLMGDFLVQSITALSNQQGLVYITIGLMDNIAYDSFSLIHNAAELSLVLIFILLVIIILSSIYNRKRGVGIFVKIASFFITVFALTAAFIYFQQETINLGSFILIVLSFIILTLSFMATRPCKA